MCQLYIILLRRYRALFALTASIREKRRETSETIFNNRQTHRPLILPFTNGVIYVVDVVGTYRRAQCTVAV